MCSTRILLCLYLTVSWQYYTVSDLLWYMMWWQYNLFHTNCINPFALTLSLIIRNASISYDNPQQDCMCHVSTGIHSKLHFPEYTAVYKYGHHGLQSPALHSTTPSRSPEYESCTPAHNHNSCCVNRLWTLPHCE